MCVCVCVYVRVCVYECVCVLIDAILQYGKFDETMKCSAVSVEKEERERMERGKGEKTMLA